MRSGNDQQLQDADKSTTRLAIWEREQRRTAAPIALCLYVYAVFATLCSAHAFSPVEDDAPHYVVKFNAVTQGAEIELCLQKAHALVDFAADSGWTMQAGFHCPTYKSSRFQYRNLRGTSPANLNREQYILDSPFAARKMRSNCWSIRRDQLQSLPRIGSRCTSSAI